MGSALADIKLRDWRLVLALLTLETQLDRIAQHLVQPGNVRIKAQITQLVAQRRQEPLHLALPRSMSWRLEAPVIVLGEAIRNVRQIQLLLHPIVGGDGSLHPIGQLLIAEAVC
jgi:hypothetical protein